MLCFSPRDAPTAPLRPNLQLPGPRRHVLHVGHHAVGRCRHALVGGGVQVVRIGRRALDPLLAADKLEALHRVGGGQQHAVVAQPLRLALRHIRHAHRQPRASRRANTSLGGGAVDVVVVGAAAAVAVVVLMVVVKVMVKEGGGVVVVAVIVATEEEENPEEAIPAGTSPSFSAAASPFP